MSRRRVQLTVSLDDSTFGTADFQVFEDDAIVFPEQQNAKGSKTKLKSPTQKNSRTKRPRRKDGNR